MIKQLLTVSISLALSGAVSFVHAEGNAKEGKTQAASCAGCHGEDGNSMVATFPKLAGQHELYLIKQLQAFKDGKRNAPMMAPLALGLTKTAIENMIVLFSRGLKR